MRKAVRAIIVRGDQTLLMHRNKFGKEYYTLIGGGIDAGESAEQALSREIFEESGYSLQGARLVFVEEAGDPYGTQYIYWCEVAGDRQPALASHSDEAKIFDMGNKHTPVWVPLKDFGGLEFRTPQLQKAIIYALRHGFPQQPAQLDAAYLDAVQANIAKKEQA